ncbi:hypothetical protein ACOME3_005528 [Neoechinorhynchus agilis]
MNHQCGSLCSMMRHFGIYNLDASPDIVVNCPMVESSLRPNCGYNSMNNIQMASLQQQPETGLWESISKSDDDSQRKKRVKCLICGKCLCNKYYIKVNAHFLLAK